MRKRRRKEEEKRREGTHVREIRGRKPNKEERWGRVVRGRGEEEEIKR